MASATLFIYDDREKAAAPTSDLVGTRPFGDITFRRARLAQRLAETVAGVDGLRFLHVQRDVDYLEALEGAREDDAGCIVWRAGAVGLDDEKVRALLTRLLLAQQDVVLDAGRTVAVMARSASSLRRPDASPWSHDFTPQGFAAMPVGHAVVDISDYRRCLRYMSGGFDARHFNAVEADRDTVTKRSENVEKIRAEHDFYYLLTPAMRRWFVAPYDLSVESGEASYKMERLYVADVALQWIHGSIGLSDFRLLLDATFAFLDARPRRKVSVSEVAGAVDSLYLAKLEERVQALKELPQSRRIEGLLANGTRYSGLDQVLAAYRRHFDRHRSSLLVRPELTIGHGDLCFSNMLFERHSALLKLIDPKGAREEAQLWTHAGYDLAKLSHSILGDYDWINNAQYRIEVSHDDRLELEILDGGAPLAALKQEFIDRLERRGIDPRVVRTCEASLFLSMLPLHIDRPNKVLALLLNATRILDELDRND